MEDSGHGRRGMEDDGMENVGKDRRAMAGKFFTLFFVCEKILTNKCYFSNFNAGG